MCSQGSKDNILGARQNILIILPQVNCRNNIGERQNLNKGVINPFQGRIVARSPLICTNVAEGHTKVKLTHCWSYIASHKSLCYI